MNEPTTQEASRTITFTQTGDEYQLAPEDTSISEMAHSCPRFFACCHGSRESHAAYRGQLIVGYWQKFHGITVRITAVYLYLTDNLRTEDHLPSLRCVGHADSVGYAEKLIDGILETGMHYALVKDAIVPETKQT